MPREIVALKDSALAIKGQRFLETPLYGQPTWSINNVFCGNNMIEKWISEGWFAFVDKKKSLEDKFSEYSGHLINSTKPNEHYSVNNQLCKELAQIAEQHFKDEGWFKPTWSTEDYNILGYIKKSEVLKKFNGLGNCLHASVDYPACKFCIRQILEQL